MYTVYRDTLKKKNKNQISVWEIEMARYVLFKIQGITCLKLENYIYFSKYAYIFSIYDFLWQSFCAIITILHCKKNFSCSNHLSYIKGNKT